MKDRKTCFSVVGRRVSLMQKITTWRDRQGMRDEDRVIALFRTVLLTESYIQLKNFMLNTILPHDSAEGLVTEFLGTYF